MPVQDPLTAADGGAPRPRRRLLKTTLLVLTVLIASALTTVFVWMARRYQQGVELAKHAQKQYGALNAEFPFQPPAAGQAIPDERWKAMLRARQRIQGQASPELRRDLAALLEAGSLKDPMVYRELLAGIPLVRRVLDEQFSALRAEQMSAREYQWMLGLAIAKVMEGGNHAPAAGGYREVLRKVERLTLADADAGNDVEARAVDDFFQMSYRGAVAAPPHALAELQGSDEASCAIDLLLASAQWAAPEGPSPEEMLRRVLPGAPKS